MPRSQRSDSVEQQRQVFQADRGETSQSNDQFMDNRLPTNNNKNRRQ